MTKREKKVVPLRGSAGPTPVPAEQDAIDNVLPRVCYPPSDSRSDVFQRCLQHFGDEGAFQTEDIKSVSLITSQCALIMTALTGNMRAYVRQGVEDLSQDQSPEQLNLRPSEVRQSLSVSDDRFEAALKRNSTNWAVLFSKAAMAAGSLESLLLKNLNEAFSQMSRLSSEIHKRQLNKVKRRTKSLKNRVRRDGIIYCQGELPGSLEHLKLSEGGEYELYRRFDFQSRKAWSGFRDVNSPDWIDALGFPPLNYMEDIEDYRQAYLNNCDSYGVETWFEAFLVKCLTDLEWLEKRCDDLQRYLLRLEAAAQLEEIDIHNLSDEEEERLFLQPPPPLSTSYEDAQKVALKMHEENISIVELRDRMNAIMTLKTTVRRLLEADIESTEKLNEQLDEFREAAQQSLKEIPDLAARS